MAHTVHSKVLLASEPGLDSKTPASKSSMRGKRHRPEGMAKEPWEDGKGIMGRMAAGEYKGVGGVGAITSIV